MRVVSINGYWFSNQKNAATETKNKAKHPKQVSEGPAQFKNFGSPDEDNFPYYNSVTTLLIVAIS